MMQPDMQGSVGVPSPPRLVMRSCSASPEIDSAASKSPWLKLRVGRAPSEWVSITVDAVPYSRSTWTRGLSVTAR